MGKKHAVFQVSRVSILLIIISNRNSVSFQQLVFLRIIPAVSVSTYHSSSQCFYVSFQQLMFLSVISSSSSQLYVSLQQLVFLRIIYSNSQCFYVSFIQIISIFKCHFSNYCLSLRIIQALILTLNSISCHICCLFNYTGIN